MDTTELEDDGCVEVKFQCVKCGGPGVIRMSPQLVDESKRLGIVYRDHCPKCRDCREAAAGTKAPDPVSQALALLANAFPDLSPDDAERLADKLIDYTVDCEREDAPRKGHVWTTAPGHDPILPGTLETAGEYWLTDSK